MRTEGAQGPEGARGQAQAGCFTHISQPGGGPTPAWSCWLLVGSPPLLEPERCVGGQSLEMEFRVCSEPPNDVQAQRSISSAPLNVHRILSRLELCPLEKGLQTALSELLTKAQLTTQASLSGILSWFPPCLFSTPGPCLVIGPDVSFGLPT